MQDVREIFVPTLLWAGLAHWWDFRPRQRLVPGREPWSQEAFNIYETSQIKSEKISDVSIGPCAWQGQNGHIACRDIKRSTKLLEQDLFSGAIFSFSLCLPSSHKYWTDLIVGGGSAGHPRRVFIVLQVGARMKWRIWWCHVTGSNKSSTHTILYIWSLLAK
jgi:hypothetical protein